MDPRLRVLYRVQRLLVYWGLVEHPYGRDYARTHITPLGRRRSDPLYRSTHPDTERSAEDRSD